MQSTTSHLHVLIVDESTTTDRKVIEQLLKSCCYKGNGIDAVFTSISISDNCQIFSCCGRKLEFVFILNMTTDENGFIPGCLFS